MLGRLPAWANALLEQARIAHLGLLDEDGRPRVQPVTFARVGDVLVTAIDAKPKRGMPARVRRIEDRPAVALTVDRYDDDWTRLAWVQVLGDATIRDMSDDVLDALTQRYPQYRTQPPPGPVIEILPIRLIWWSASG